MAIIPDYAGETIGQTVYLRFRVGELEELARAGKAVRLTHEVMPQLITHLNAHSGQPFQEIISIYWSFSPAQLLGVVDQIRTTLAGSVAQLRATLSTDHELPSAAETEQALQLALTVDRGGNNSITVNTAQANRGGQSDASMSSKPQDEQSPGWSCWKKIGAIAGGSTGTVR